MKGVSGMQGVFQMGGVSKMGRVFFSVFILAIVFAMAVPKVYAFGGSGNGEKGEKGVFLVTDYGAIPNDGVCDVAAIQAAINDAVAAGGGVVLIPDGVYTISTRAGNQNLLIQDANGVTLRGESQDGTILSIDYIYGDTNFTNYVLYINNCTNLELSNLTIEGNNSWHYNQSIVRVANASSDIKIHNLTIQNFPFNATLLRQRGEIPWAIHVVGSSNQSRRPQRVEIANNTIRNISNLWNPSPDYEPDEDRGDMNGGAIRVQRAYHVNIHHNVIDNTGRGGIHVRNGSQFVQIRNNIVTNTGVGKYDKSISDGGHDHGKRIGLDCLAIEIFNGNSYIIIEDNDVDCWLSLDSTSYTAVRRNKVDGKYLRLWAGLESAGSEDTVTQNNIFVDNYIGAGMTGISVSNNGLKEYHYFARNIVNALPMWAVNLHGYAEDRYIDVSSIERFYFKDCYFTNSDADDLGVHYPGNGHAVKLVNNVRYVTFDGCVFDNNDGYAVQANNSDGNAKTKSDALSFVNCTFTNNKKGVFNYNEYPDTNTTAFEVVNPTVYGNGDDTIPDDIPFLNPKPEANFEAPIIGFVGEEITFISTSEGANGVGIKHCLWDLGAGYPQTGEEVTYTYDKPGTYLVSLVVWDENNRGAVAEQWVTILDYEDEDGVAILRPTEEQMDTILEASGSEIIFDFGEYDAVDIYFAASWFKDVDKTITIVTAKGSDSVKTKSLWNNSGKDRLVIVRNGKLSFKNI